MSKFKYALLFLGWHYSLLAQEQVGDFQYEMKVMTQGLDGCEPESLSQDCNYIRYAFPKVQKAPNESLKNQLNALVFDFLGQQSGVSSEQEILDHMAGFIQEARENRNAGGAYWYEENEVEITGLGEVISLHYHNEGYLGGAHGFALFTDKHYHSSILKEIDLNDIFWPGYEKPFFKIAEQAFKEDQGLKPDADLLELGYEFYDGFRISENYVFSQEGITFNYNYYEAGPYAMVPPTFFLSFSELRAWIREDNPLGILGSPQSLPQENCRFIFKGKLAQLDITLCFYPDNNDGRVSGHYYYGDGAKGKLLFQGTAQRQSDGSYLQKLEERNAQGQITGYFVGKLQNGMMTGTWTNPEGNRSFAYQLKLQP